MLLYICPNHRAPHTRMDAPAEDGPGDLGGSVRGRGQQERTALEGDRAVGRLCP